MPDPLYSGRYTQAFLIVPDDTKQIVGPPVGGGTASHCNGIHCLTAGNVTARFLDGRNLASVTFPVLAGVIYPYALTMVYSATTATLLGLR